MIRVLQMQNTLNCLTNLAKEGSVRAEKKVIELERKLRKAKRGEQESMRKTRERNESAGERVPTETNDKDPVEMRAWIKKAEILDDLIADDPRLYNLQDTGHPVASRISELKRQFPHKSLQQCSQAVALHPCDMKYAAEWLARQDEDDRCSRRPCIGTKVIDLSSDSEKEIERRPGDVLQTGPSKKRRATSPDDDECRSRNEAFRHSKRSKSNTTTISEKEAARNEARRRQKRLICDIRSRGVPLDDAGKPLVLPVIEEYELWNRAYQSEVDSVPDIRKGHGRHLITLDTRERMKLWLRMCFKVSSQARIFPKSMSRAVFRTFEVSRGEQFCGDEFARTVLEVFPGVTFQKTGTRMPGYGYFLKGIKPRAAAVSKW